MLYKEFPFLKIEVEENDGLIILTWNGKFNSSEKYRSAVIHSVEAVRKYKLKGWLADARNIDEIHPEDQKWTNENVLFPAYALGITKVAIVIPESVYNHLAISAIMVGGKGKYNFDSQYFLNLEDAYSWLKRA